MRGRILLAAICLAGCIRSGKNGTIIDFRACTPKLAEEKPIESTPVVFASDRGDQTISSAIAWHAKDQQAIQLFVSTAALACKDVVVRPDSYSTNGFISGALSSMTIAPVLIDTPLEVNKGTPIAIIPSGETWRVTRLSVPSLAGKPPFFNWTSKVEGDARGAAELGRHTKLRVRAEAWKGARTFAGELDVLGCGEVEIAEPARLQPALDLRIGNERLVIRSATFQLRPHGGWRFQLSTMAGGCGKRIGADAVVDVREDGIDLSGVRFVEKSYSRSPHHLHLQPIGGSPDLFRADFTGEIRTDAETESPRFELDARDWDRHLALSGHVEALKCPPDED